MPIRSPATPNWLERHASAIVVGLIAVYVLIFATTCLVKYRFYLYRDFDLAIFTQATAQLLRGSMFSSIRGLSWPGDHSSLHLLWVAPIYAVAPSPLTLLAIQTIALGLVAWPVYRLARAVLQDRAVAIGCVALALLYPAIGYVNLFEFHPEALSVPALIASVYFLHRGQTSRMVLAMGFALLGKEDVAFLALMLAAYALTLRRSGDGRRALWLAGLGAASLALTFLVLKPRFGSPEADYASMYRHWGGTPGAILAGLARQPWRAVASLFWTEGDPADSIAKGQTYLHLLLPLAGLPLLAPRLLLVALPIVLEHFLSHRTPQHSISYQYSALIAPMVLAAAVAGLAWLGRSRRARQGLRRIRIATAVALALAVLSQVLFGPFSPWHALQSVQPNQSVWPSAEDRMLRPHRDRLVAGAPSHGGVVASFEYLARFAHRPNVHSFHHVFDGTYTVSSRPYPIPEDAVALLARLGEQRVPAKTERLERLIELNHLEAVDAAGDEVLFVRRSEPGVVLLGPLPPSARQNRAIVFDDQVALLGGRLLSTSTTPGGRIDLETWWQRLAPVDRFFFTEFSIFDGQERERFRRSRYLGYGTTIAERWPLGAAFFERYNIVVPTSLPPGRYTIQLRVGRRLGNLQALAVSDDPELEARGGWIELGRFEVTLTD